MMTRETWPSVRSPTVDWIYSMLVLQHIPPMKGLAILKTLLANLAPGGVVSLQFTAYREPVHLNAAFGEARFVRFDGAALHVVEDAPGPEVRMAMFDCDMTAVLAAYASAGVNGMWVEHVDHNGHHAFWVIGARD